MVLLGKIIYIQTRRDFFGSAIKNIGERRGEKRAANNAKKANEAARWLFSLFGADPLVQSTTAAT